MAAFDNLNVCTRPESPTRLPYCGLADPNNNRAMDSEISIVTTFRGPRIVHNRPYWHLASFNSVFYHNVRCGRGRVPKAKGRRDYGVAVHLAFANGSVGLPVKDISISSYSQFPLGRMRWPGSYVILLRPASFRG